MVFKDNKLPLWYTLARRQICNLVPIHRKSTHKETTFSEQTCLDNRLSVNIKILQEFSKRDAIYFWAC